MGKFSPSLINILIKRKNFATDLLVIVYLAFRVNFVKLTWMSVHRIHAIMEANVLKQSETVGYAHVHRVTMVQDVKNWLITVAHSHVLMVDNASMALTHTHASVWSVMREPIVKQKQIFVLLALVLMVTVYQTQLIFRAHVIRVMLEHDVRSIRNNVQIIHAKIMLYVQRMAKAVLNVNLKTSVL